MLSEEFKKSDFFFREKPVFRVACSRNHFLKIFFSYHLILAWYYNMLKDQCHWNIFFRKSSVYVLWNRPKTQKPVLPVPRFQEPKSNGRFGLRRQFYYIKHVPHVRVGSASASSRCPRVLAVPGTVPFTKTNQLSPIPLPTPQTPCL